MLNAPFPTMYTTAQFTSKPHSTQLAVVVLSAVAGASATSFTELALGVAQCLPFSARGSRSTEVDDVTVGGLVTCVGGLGAFATADGPPNISSQ